jgi:hypothetical protein
MQLQCAFKAVFALPFFFIATLMSAQEITPQGEPICRLPADEPKLPSEDWVGRFENRDDGTSTPRDRIAKLNSTTPILFRVTNFVASLPIRVLYKNNGGYTAGPIAYPGSSIDVSRSQLFYAYYCAGSAVGECDQSVPVTLIGRYGDGRQCIGWRRWIAGWFSVLAVPSSSATKYEITSWSNYDSHKVWNVESRSTFIEVDKTATYSIGGRVGGESPRIFVDGRDEGLLPEGLNFYTGTKFEVQPIAGKPTDLNFRFVQ